MRRSSSPHIDSAPVKKDRFIKSFPQDTLLNPVLGKRSWIKGALVAASIFIASPRAKAEEKREISPSALIEKETSVPAVSLSSVPSTSAVSTASISSGTDLEDVGSLVLNGVSMLIYGCLLLAAYKKLAKKDTHVLDGLSGSSLAIASMAPVALATLTAEVGSFFWRDSSDTGALDALIQGAQKLSGVSAIGLAGTAFVIAAMQGFEMAKNRKAQGLDFKDWFTAATRHGDANRRRAMDPSTWQEFAQQNNEILQTRRLGILRAGKAIETLTVGLPVTTAMLIGAQTLIEGTVFDVSQVLATLSPAATVMIYRLARGSPLVSRGPMMTEELSPILDQPHLDEGVRRLTLKRLRRGILPVGLKAEMVIRDDFREKLGISRKAIADAQLLEMKDVPLLKSKIKVIRDQEDVVSHEKQYPQTSVVLNEKNGKFIFELSQKLELKFSDYAYVSRYLGGLSMDGYRSHYLAGKLKPSDVLKMLRMHPEVNNRSVFARDMMTGDFAKYLQKATLESDRYFKEGRPRPLEGMFVAWKDLGVGPDGVMYVGSRVLRISKTEKSSVLKRLMDYGAIVVPVNMVAGANGGTGAHNGHSYVPNPVLPGYDPAGSSSATAYVVSHPELPFVLGLGSQTGGSGAAPASVCGVYCFAPAQGMIPKDGLVPLATFLDRVVVMGQHEKDTLALTQMISFNSGRDPQQTKPHLDDNYRPAIKKPRVVVLESHLKSASLSNARHVADSLEQLRQQGYEIVKLGSEWDFLVDVPFHLYPVDSYAASAMAHANPLQENYLDAPRTVLDPNLIARYPKAIVALEGRLYDESRALSADFQAIVEKYFPAGTLLLSPPPEPVPTKNILNGTAGPLLDQHDLYTMVHNRIPSWGQMTLAAGGNEIKGLLLHGKHEDMLRVSQDLKRPPSLKVEVSQRAVFLGMRTPPQKAEIPLKIIPIPEIDHPSLH